MAKLAVFAMRLDACAVPEGQATFYIGTNDPDELTALRRRILREFDHVPVSGEYVQRARFDICDRYGKDTVRMIDWLGTDKLPMFFAMRGAFDARLNNPALARGLTDRAMQIFARLPPDHLPRRLRDWRNRHGHHLILRMRDGGTEEAQAFLHDVLGPRDGDFFCHVLHQDCIAKKGVDARVPKSRLLTLVTRSGGTADIEARNVRGAPGPGNRQIAITGG